MAKKLRITLVLTLLAFGGLLRFNTTEMEASFESGSLKSGQNYAGNYATYSARYTIGTNYGTTSASWYRGGGGTVSILMNGGVLRSNTGNQLSGPTTIGGYGTGVQTHRYYGGPSV
ncbi:hypothetical protein G7062_07185 [Erysipelothrix sp. HDW6C]|uniref:hypothetical protein n=1 Tax=Erysipelothrix sp. HDW6C TaxID=2714930 RepID=UPI001408D91C|nr:hypothetical protein [Erysipelothrix sp. HDW6C]QIK70078.1 hypothetical protein G7062_07185 [Erysipelothrix sp. HDW6C]